MSRSRNNRSKIAVLAACLLAFGMMLAAPAANASQLTPDGAHPFCVAGMGVYTSQTGPVWNGGCYQFASGATNYGDNVMGWHYVAKDVDGPDGFTLFIYVKYPNLCNTGGGSTQYGFQYMPVGWNDQTTQVFFVDGQSNSDPECATMTNFRDVQTNFGTPYDDECSSGNLASQLVNRVSSQHLFPLDMWSAMMSGSNGFRCGYSSGTP